MLNITKKAEGQKLTICLDGRLDTTTAPDLENEVKNSLEGINELVMDVEKCVYISSAGLRVLLSAQKIMSKRGGMVVKNVTPEVSEIFEVTGFSDILTIE